MYSEIGTKLLVIVVILVVVDIIALGIYFTVHSSNSSCSDIDSSGDVLSPLPPSNSTLGIFNKAAIVAVGAPCSGFGRDILAKGGSIVDATIATMLCEGVCVMQSMGVGAGSIMTIYNKPEGKVYTMISRETAPGKATRDMFVNHPGWSTGGPLSIAVPGELKGYQEAYKRFGKLPWRDLFLPTIKLCEDGVPVNKMMAKNFRDVADRIKNSTTFQNIILKSTGGRIPNEGEYLKLPQLANTLRIIAESPKMADELYNGSLTKQFVADIQSAGGIITEEDMNSYNVRWEEPYSANLSGGLTVYSAALPGSGILVTFMLRLLDGLIQFAVSDIERSQLIIESFKHAFGRRSDLGDPYYVNRTVLDKVITELTDHGSIMSIREKIKSTWTTDNVTYYGADFIPQDHGTHHMVFVAPDGSAVSVTATMNMWCGSTFVSNSTGILLNSQMDDFSTPGIPNYFGVPPSEANFIQPGKRPLSSMSPTIVVDSQGSVRLVIGAAGGTKITTQTTLAIIRNLWLGKNIKEAIDEPRFHHQLLPMEVSYERGILKEMVDAWRSIGHSASRVTYPVDFIAVVTGIARLGENLTANCDWRRPGHVNGF